VVTIDSFIDLIQREIGLPVTVEDADLHLDQVPDWDSMHLLALLIALERETGQRVSMPDVLEASSLKEIYMVVAQT
jgi:acyl carrier protein